LNHSGRYFSIFVFSVKIIAKSQGFGLNRQLVVRF
jgi:hypothetical protein